MWLFGGGAAFFLRDTTFSAATLHSVFGAVRGGITRGFKESFSAVKLKETCWTVESDTAVLSGSR